MESLLVYEYTQWIGEINLKKRLLSLKFGANLLFVSNVTKAREWYESVLGMKVVEFRPPEFLHMKLGENNFYIETPNLKRAVGFRGEKIGGRTSIVFDVDDIHTAVQDMKRKKVKIVVEPVQQFWGGWNAVISDPDGNEFILDED